MKFQKLHARVYGPLRDRELALAPDVVLIAGPNESGKSSFRSALETLLYGFDPATRDAHPLHLFDPSAGDLWLEAELCLDSGERLAVERVLQASGKLRTADAIGSFAGPKQGNAALPCVAHLPRALFRAIYALELEQLVALDEGVRVHIDALLLPARGELALRAPALVLRELRKEHQQLWRADNLGKPRARELRRELAQARSQLRESSESERALRGDRAELEQLEQRLVAGRERRTGLELEARDAPLLGALFELGRRRRAAGAEPDLSELGDWPLQDPAIVQREQSELLERQIVPRARLERPALALSQETQRLLEQAPELEVALASVAALESEHARLQERFEDAGLLERSAARELQPILARPLDDALLQATRELQLEPLRFELEGWAQAHERITSGLLPPPPLPTWPLFTGALGFALVTLAALGMLDARLSVPAAALVFASLLGLWGRLSPPAPAGPPARPAGIDALLAALPLDARLLETPTGLQRAVDALARARLALEDASEKRVDAEVREAALDEREHALRDLARSHGLAAEGELAAVLLRIRQALDLAQQRASAVAHDEREREAASRSLAETEPLLARRRQQLEILERVLRAAEPEAANAHEAFERLQLRREELRFVREREAELRREARYEHCARDPRVQGPQLPEAAPWRPELVAARSEELRELDEAMLKDTRRAGELRERLDSAPAGALARAADRVAELQQELDALARERDRLALLENLIARAEREYRERHQPDVLRRASAYLERISGGRYTRLVWLDGATGEAAASVAEPGSAAGATSAAPGGLYAEQRDRGEPLLVGAPLSRGTLDQIHLCFRLGLLDHLDESRERLPLILDDALLRMDAARRREAYALLKELSAQRQVFLLTCHESLAAEAALAWQTEATSLGAPGARALA